MSEERLMDGFSSTSHSQLPVSDVCRKSQDMDRKKDTVNMPGNVAMQKCGETFTF